MLRLDTLSKIYADGTHALARVSVNVAAGEIACLIGGSGCGKTTLLRLVAGLDLASGGSIEVDGEVIREPHPAIGIVFQEPRLFPWLSVADNVGFGLAEIGARERRLRVDEALEHVGLARFGSRWPRELSGGQQQRVAIARAFVARPKVLLLDEPFSALDAFTRASLNAHLLALWAESRPTILMVTHDVDEAALLGDRVIVMQPQPGRIFDDIKLTLARPRDRLDEGFDTARRQILSALDRSLAPAARQA